MDISIGMKRDRMKQLGDELLRAVASSQAEVIVYAKGNNANVGEVIVTINNDDMERDDIAADEVYVDVDE